MSNIPATTAQATAPLSMELELGSTAVASKLWLLNVPGEIRNRIYEFAVEKKTISLRHITTKPRRTLRKDRPKRRRKFFGLTQVCHQIRSEYLSLYGAQTKVICRVRPCEGYDYIETFLMRPGVKEEDVVGNLIIDFAMGNALPTDIKPLLQLSRRAKHLSVQIKNICQEDHNGTLEELVDQVLAVENKSTFCKWLETAVFSLELICNNDHAFIDDIAFSINDAHWTPWMKYWSTWYWGWGPNHEEWPKFKEWCFNSGFFPYRTSAFTTYISFRKRD